MVMSSSSNQDGLPCKEPVYIMNSLCTRAIGNRDIDFKKNCNSHNLLSCQQKLRNIEAVLSAGNFRWGSDSDLQDFWKEPNNSTVVLGSNSWIVRSSRFFFAGKRRFNISIVTSRAGVLSLTSDRMFSDFNFIYFMAKIVLYVLSW